MIDLEVKDTAVIAKTKELCETLLEQDSFKQMKTNIDSFLSNDEAQRQYYDVTQLQRELSEKQRMGQALSEQEIAGFEAKRDELLANDVANNFVSAQQNFAEMQDSINQYLQKTIELGRLPTEEELQPDAGGCCGGGGGGNGGGCGCA